MKELSTEEKAKRYDKALEVLHKYDGANIMFSQSLKEEMFPELRESEDEDEKMKKIISDILLIDSDDIREILESNGVLMQDVDAWLEKIVEHLKFCKTIQIGDRVTRNEGGVLVNMSQLDRIAKPRKIQSDLLSCDKVEPKFHEGEWVIYNRNDHSREILQIYDIRDNRYYFNDNIHFSWSVKECDEQCHLWTIADAKVGDVLAAEVIDEKYFSPFIAIYKERGLDFFNSYCFVTLNGEFVGEGDTGHDIKEVHPATKGQCGILFTKMKEAGYEWDAENSQLKKIDQKPTSKVAKFCEGDRIQFKGFGHNKYTIKEVCGLSHYINTMGNRMDMSYTDANFEVIKDSDKVKLSSSWSEEDKERIKNILSVLGVQECWDGATGEKMNPYQKEIDWLKSLKSRVIPQFKCNKEDINKLNHVIKLIDYHIIDGNYCYGHDGRDYLSKNETIDFLNLLKEKYIWKPSEEQIKVLEFFISYVTKCNVVLQKSKDTLLSLLSDLKKLK